MCTAVTYQTNDFYFGRNLDLHVSYHEKITITPRHFPFYFRNGVVIEHHYAIIGMAAVSDGYPLYYDATNEKGLSLAGLNFPDNAVYKPINDHKENVAPFELIPWILSQCGSVTEAIKMLKGISLWKEAYSPLYPLSPLHWLLSDKYQSVVLEPLADGLKIIENPVGVLTNSPRFEYHMYNLANYMNLTCRKPNNRFSDEIELTPYSLGLGGFGLPGDLSSGSRFIKATFTKLNSLSGNSESESRFIKATFTKLNSLSGNSESESISQFFHILGSVAQQRGLTEVDNEQYEYTIYSSCCNTDKCIYYYTTYGNSQVCAVAMWNENLDSDELVVYPLIEQQQINFQNNCPSNLQKTAPVQS